MISKRQCAATLVQICCLILSTSHPVSAQDSKQIQIGDRGWFLHHLGDSSNVEGVSFWHRTYRGHYNTKCAQTGGADVVGIVPPSADLSNDSLARSLLDEGEKIHREQCHYSGIVHIELIPSTYTTPDGGLYAPILVMGLRHSNGPHLRYENYVIQAEQKRQQANVRKSQQEEVQRRLGEFVRRYSIAEWVDQEKLIANPFAYQGKTVGLLTRFDHMLTSSSALVGQFVFADIPNNTFTTRAQVLIAGRVLGNTEVKLPVVGPTLLPHLKFVGVHICEQDKCAEILISKE